ncbi:MAG: hypothetical protein DME19_19410 [Verrucomicrobia bacterium]|nr:MAG: hypothetical protein DME19_19410 [Verrucomicrobiota bacterium]
MRPQTLAEVATQTRAGESFDFVLRNFLDEFEARPGPRRLIEEPARLAGVVAEGERHDAFLAATAETLAARHGFEIPAWAEGRKLRRPWFALPWTGLRALLLLESPAAFRSRNLFVSANALVRV